MTTPIRRTRDYLQEQWGLIALAAVVSIYVQLFYNITQSALTTGMYSRSTIIVFVAFAITTIATGGLVLLIRAFFERVPINQAPDDLDGI